MNNTNTDNSQQNSNNAKPAITAADIPLALKAKYFGSGVVVGVFVSPLVKRMLATVQPKMEGILESLTGQAEGLVEKGSDFMAKAKDMMGNSNGTETAVEHRHTGSCSH